MKSKYKIFFSIPFDKLEAKVNGEENNFDGLKMQNVGSIWIMTWECQARADDVELINRDTK